MYEQQPSLDTHFYQQQLSPVHQRPFVPPIEIPHNYQASHPSLPTSSFLVSPTVQGNGIRALSAYSTGMPSEQNVVSHTSVDEAPDIEQGSSPVSGAVKMEDSSSALRSPSSPSSRREPSNVVIACQQWYVLSPQFLHSPSLPFSSVAMPLSPSILFADIRACTLVVWH